MQTGLSKTSSTIQPSVEGKTAGPDVNVEIIRKFHIFNHLIPVLCKCFIVLSVLLLSLIGMIYVVLLQQTWDRIHLF